MNRRSRIFGILLLIGFIPELLSCGGSGTKSTTQSTQIRYTEKVLYTFTGQQDGGKPWAGVVADSHGNLYGTTAAGNGVVFQLSPPGTPGNPWMFKEIANIDGALFDSDGGALIQRGGNLYGESSVGVAGPCPQPPPPLGCGYVFELSPPAGSTGPPWTNTVLYTFTGGANGDFPFAGLISDTNGNLYGLAIYDGGLYEDLVFELTPPSNGSGPWTETVPTVIYNVENYVHHGMLARDSNGNLYLNTYGEDGIGPGWIDGFSPPPGGTGPWTGFTLYEFTGGADGGFPNGGMIFDTQGNLYGTARDVVYELSPPVSSSGSWTEKVLYTFRGGTDGAYPSDRLIFDSQGNLYGTASGGGDAAGSSACAYAPGCGVVFKLTPPSSGTGPWTETVLYTFTGGSDGGVPRGGVIFDSSGNLYGTAAGGGNSAGNGVVFELISSS